MMAIGESFAVLCAESIVETRSREAVRATLLASGREIVEISLGQMQAFAGNVLELAPPSSRVIALSTTAWGCLDAHQRRALEKHGNVLAADIPVIERFGGGGVRCMLAEVHLPPSTVAASSGVIIAVCWNSRSRRCSRIYWAHCSAVSCSGACAASISAARAAAMPAPRMRCARKAGCSRSSVFVIDIGKGVLAVLYLPRRPCRASTLDPEMPRAWLTLACGFAVIVGHVYPVWFAFRGGKGVATMIGVVGALDPRLLLPVLGSWFVVLVLTGYVGLASMLAGAALSPSCIARAGQRGSAVFLRGHRDFVVFTHRGNIARMRAGNEHRVQRLWLFRSRTA